MATNGGSNGPMAGDRAMLESVERAITGSRLAMQPTKAATPNDDSISAYNEALAEQYRALGRHALEHGQYINQACSEYADRLLSEHRKLVATVMQAERKLVADAENFIGK